MNRNLSVDICRTLAIILMIVFHFIFDLKFVGFVDVDIPDGLGWKQFRWLIISIFFLCFGASLAFAYANVFSVKKYVKRTTKIALAALIISAVTYFYMPQNWIFFGVLHFFVLASVVSLPFIRRPKVSLAIGVTIIGVGMAQIIPHRWPWDVLFLGQLPRYTNDFIALFPWLGMVFVGIGLGHAKWLNNDPFKSISFIQIHQMWLTYPGRHSLLIYLIHQPIIISILLAVKMFGY